MRSAKLTAPRRIEIVEEPVPVPSEGEVLIRIRAAGICGSDLHIYQGERPDVALPRVMGHELVGEVRATGPGADRFREGDRVAVDPVVSCGSCPSCRRGLFNLCGTVRCLGVQVEGGFQDCFVAPEEKVHALPEGLPWERLALVEPYSIAAEVLARSEVRPGDRVLVIGSGTIGLCILQGMRIAGAEVLVTDLVESRLEAARRLGAARAVNGRTEDLAAALREFTDGFGVDVVVEAVGHPRLLEESLTHAAPGGRIVVLGFHGEPARIPEVSLVRKELKIAGSRMSCGRFPQVIDWFREGRVDPEALISAVYPFDRIGDAFRDILAAPERFLKVVLTF